MSIIERAKGSIFYDENKFIYRVKVPIGRDSKTGVLKYKTRHFKTKKEALAGKKEMLRDYCSEFTNN
jgi:hypothetical protein